MELPGLGAVRARQVEKRKREPVQAQDVDRTQTCHPPDPGWGWRSSCCRLGTRDIVGRGWAPLSTPSVGAASLPVSTTETAGPRVSDSEQGLQPGTSREGSLGAIHWF